MRKATRSRWMRERVAQSFKKWQSHMNAALCSISEHGLPLQFPQSYFPAQANCAVCLEIRVFRFLCIWVKR